MNQKRVFVAGATGVLGRRVVELLVSQGCAANMSVNSKALEPRAATSNYRSSPFITSTRTTNSSPSA